jgi:DNA-directed RNA polymerase sigma subunit (sigma70/sigma32)
MYERLGIYDNKFPKTLKEAGANLKITSENVRQLENKAIKRLRAYNSVESEM